MYISRLNFYSVPGKTRELEERLGRLLELVAKFGGERPRILRTHLASLGAPDLIFEQEVTDLNALEDQIQKVTGSQEFQQWTQEISELLAQSSKREIFEVSKS
ncbi:MAG TPA: hypothetical protein VE616_08050 [Candidatus Udaeobacter sp.]|jgi:hypothetical protein|nr:hypothetical protein [Candidatus Udaeobacter sp.]